MWRYEFLETDKLPFVPEPEATRRVAAVSFDTLQATRLAEQDVVLVHEEMAHRDLLLFASGASLKPFLTPKKQVPIGSGNVAKAFQLDTVEIESGRIVVKERVAMVPRFGGGISNTHELATLWLMWNLSGM